MLKVSILAVLLVACHAKQFTRCGLVQELRRQGFPQAQLRNWVCLVEKESNRMTHVVSKVNSNGSRDHGLYQINDKYWCSTTNTPGKDCNVTCKDLRTDNITKASTCAKKIYARHGFGAWYGWRSHCQNKPLPDISKC